jgi:hypothetical protein
MIYDLLKMKQLSRMFELNFAVVTDHLNYLSHVLFDWSLAADCHADVDVNQIGESDARFFALAVQIEESQFLLAYHERIDLQGPHNLDHLVEVEELTVQFLLQNRSIDHLQFLSEFSNLEMFADITLVLFTE